MQTAIKLGLLAMLAVPGVAQAVVVTPLAGGVEIVVSVSDYIDNNVDAQSDFATLVGVPASLAAATSAVVINNAGGSITAQGEVYADWITADSGVVMTRNFGWQFSGGAIGQAVTAGGTNWYYQFYTPNAAVLDWSYNVIGYYENFGLWGFQLYLDGNPLGATMDPYSPTSGGTLTASLAGGQQHNLMLVNGGNIEAGGDVFGFMDGNFLWTITGATVPEPASWAMLIAGFGMVGGALRLGARSARRQPA